MTNNSTINQTVSNKKSLADEVFSKYPNLGMYAGIAEFTYFAQDFVKFNELNHWQSALCYGSMAMLGAAIGQEIFKNQYFRDACDFMANIFIGSKDKEQSKDLVFTHKDKTYRTVSK